MFNRWSGDRRLKNVICIIEWAPDPTALGLRETAATVPPAAARKDLQRALELLLLDTEEGTQSSMQPERLSQLVHLNFDITFAPGDADSLTEAQALECVFGSEHRQVLVLQCPGQTSRALGEGRA